MAFRRRNEARTDPFYGPAVRFRHNTLEQAHEMPAYRSRAPQRGYGWARRRDIDDAYNQAAAPRGGGRYDRSGQEGYARGLEAFEADEEQFGGAPFEYGRGASMPSWGLDEGAVQFGGPHRGRGPRGYQRSNERIREDICDCLTEAPDIDASNIDVAVTAGTVTLSGSVDSRTMKRRAEDIAEGISGVGEVLNHLRLQPADATDEERE